MAAESLGSRMAAALASPAAARLAAPDRIDAELEQFGTALIAAAEALAAHSALPESSIYFESMPGFEAYSGAAQTASDCVRA